MPWNSRPKSSHGASLTVSKFVFAVLFVFAAHFAAAQDQIPLAQVNFVDPGGDLGAFAITTSISHVDITDNGVNVTFDKRDGDNRWPDFTEPSGFGPLQYSLGLVEKINGVWYANAPIETWFGNNTIGGPIQSATQISGNWFYATRWGPLYNYQPQPGEQLGLFVVAGDPRNNYTPLHERSNIVLFNLPSPNTTASFDFPVQAPTPPPDIPPAPTPAVVVTPPTPPAPVVVITSDPTPIPSTPIVTPPVVAPTASTPLWQRLLEDILSALGGIFLSKKL